MEVRPPVSPMGHGRCLLTRWSRLCLPSAVGRKTAEFLLSELPLRISKISPLYGAGAARLSTSFCQHQHQPCFSSLGPAAKVLMQYSRFSNIHDDQVFFELFYRAISMIIVVGGFPLPSSQGLEGPR